MQQNQLYCVKNIISGTNTLEAEVILNPEHVVYKVHFPGNPVTPGVCLLQILKELMQSFHSVKLITTKLKNLKFLQVVNPHQHPQLNCKIQWVETEETFEGSATIGQESLLFLKVSFVMKKDA